MEGILGHHFAPLLCIPTLCHHFASKHVRLPPAPGHKTQCAGSYSRRNLYSRPDAPGHIWTRDPLGARVCLPDMLASPPCITNLYHHLASPPCASPMQSFLNYPNMPNRKNPRANQRPRKWWICQSPILRDTSWILL